MSPHKPFRISVCVPLFSSKLLQYLCCPENNKSCDKRALLDPPWITMRLPADLRDLTAHVDARAYTTHHWLST